MGTRMSEQRQSPSAPHSALAHAGELAQWVLLLLGWLWLGEQGMRLGWSVASGVLAVSLWWAARLLCRGSNWALNAPPTVMAVCGGLSALGVWLPEALRSVEAQDLNLPHVGLLAVALIWGAWSGMVETRSRVSTFDLGPVAWHPVLAALAVGWVACTGWAGWASVSAASSTVAVSVLLLVCAAVLHAREHDIADVPRVCRAQRSGLPQVLAPSAMGLMMGGLWLGNVWCAGWGWTTQEMVLWHLAMMAVLPALVALAIQVPAHSSTTLKATFSASTFGVLRGLHPHPNETCAHANIPCSTRPMAVFRPHLSLGLLALGALMLLGQSAVHGLLAMLLPSLAWAIHCSRPRSTPAMPVSGSPRLKQSIALGLGPGLLMWVGLASPVHGPLAMQAAMALLGALAAVQAMVFWIRPPVTKLTGLTP